MMPKLLKILFLFLRFDYLHC